MERLFPVIKATDNERIPLVSKHTVSYIHALMIDPLTAAHTSSVRLKFFQPSTPSPMLFETKEVWSKNLRCTRMSFAQNYVIA